MSHTDNTVKAKVLFEYQAQQEGDLSLRVGEIVTVLKQEGGWWEGELNGASGVFPSNYVQLL